MIYSAFCERVRHQAFEADNKWAPRGEADDAAFTIGSANIAGTGLWVAVARIKTVPTLRSLGGQLRTKWYVASEPTENGFIGLTGVGYKQVHPSVENAQMWKFPLTGVPNLPGQAAMTVSTLQEFYPTIVMPESQIIPGTEDEMYDSRYQIVIPLNGQAEV